MLAFLLLWKSHSNKIICLRLVTAEHGQNAKTKGLFDWEYEAIGAGEYSDKLIVCRRGTNIDPNEDKRKSEFSQKPLKCLSACVFCFTLSSSVAHCSHWEQLLLPTKPLDALDIRYDSRGQGCEREVLSLFTLQGVLAWRKTNKEAQ